MATGGISQRGRTREQQESGVRGWCERLDVEESLLRDQCQEFPINKGRLEAAGKIAEKTQSGLRRGAAVRSCAESVG